MNVGFVIRPDERRDVEELREWLGDIEGVTVTATSSTTSPTSQGTVWDLLSVVCGTGGPAVAALKALEIWLKARVTEVEVQIGAAKFKVTSPHAAEHLEGVARVLKQLESGNVGDDTPA